MSLSDINWGAVIYGAGIATAVVAFGLTPVLTSALGYGGALVAAAVIGGITGEFFSDITDKCGHAARVLANSPHPDTSHAL